MKRPPNIMKTGWTAFRMGLVAYVIPYIFAFNPVLLLQGGDGSVMQTILALITAVAGVFFFTYASEGYLRDHLHPIIRLIFVGGALCLMIPGVLTDIIGAGVIVLGIFLTKVLHWTPRKKTNPSSEDKPEPEQQ